jgi:Kef-type K+ transport system membrane component KefB/nucleotide-binding universal stress UspA family protein
MSAADLERLIVLPTLAVGVIIAVSRLLGLAFRRWRQPQVVGELVAGLLLGPSFFGWVAPAPFAALFPSDVLPFLKLLSDYGIVFFMFLIGLELDPNLLRDRGRAATAISTASIAVPLFLGGLLALLLYDSLAPVGVPRSTFAVFFAVAMAITAFPVLARILIERDLLRSQVGAMTLTCAAVNDLSAWCLLAAVLAMARSGTTAAAAGIVVAAAAYVTVMFMVVRPLGQRLEIIYRSRGGLTQNLLATVFLLLFASALAAHWAGIHLIFGAFLFGAVLPKQSGFVRELSEKIEDFTTVFLLPIYFAYTGLRTDVGLLDSASSWMLCGLIIVVASAGKFIGSSVAARATGLAWREAAALGALMNTRGLMELIILNVGLDLGIVGPSVFAMMVLMAIVTTLVATPALDALYPAERLRAEALGAKRATDRSVVLVPVALSASGPQLLDLAVALAADADARVYALHVGRPVERGALGANDPRPDPSRPETLVPLLNRAAERRIDVHPLSITSSNAADAICEVARLKGANLIVMGWHRPVFRQSILSGTLERVMRHSDADVAVLIDKGTQARPRRFLLPYTGTSHDRAALRLAVHLAGRMEADLTVLHVVRPGRSKPALEIEAGRMIEAESSEQLERGGTARLVVVESDDPLETVLQRAGGYGLVIVGIGEEWDLTPGTLGMRQERIAADTSASLLIIRGAGERAALPDQGVGTNTLANT